MANKLQIKLIKSPISCQPGQRRTLRALGLRKIGQTVQHDDGPAIRGMIRAVRFMVDVVESK
ncbi:MAG TPA: 50S ribosomal protein L30 [Bacillota bacterium]|nr:50S ribosomal protein L30 [Bacillota bacterium]